MALSRPDALIPHVRTRWPTVKTLFIATMVYADTAHIIPGDVAAPSPAFLVLSGWPDAGFHAAGVNFAFWAFSEVRCFLGALSYLVPWRTYISLSQEYGADAACWRLGGAAR